MLESKKVRALGDGMCFPLLFTIRKLRPREDSALPKARFGSKLTCISHSVLQNTVQITLIGRSYQPCCPPLYGWGKLVFSKSELTKITPLLEAELGIKPRSSGTNSWGFFHFPTFWADVLFTTKTCRLPCWPLALLGVGNTYFADLEVSTLLWLHNLSVKNLRTVLSISA